MAPKTRSSKDKNEWRVCPDSGVLYHSADAPLHAAWLSAGPPPLGAPPPPPYAHVSLKQYHAPLSLTDDLKTLVSLPLSESVKYGSIFLPKPVLNPCQIGFASWVRVSSSSGFEAVLRAFPLAGAAGGLVAGRSSWLGRAAAAGRLTEESVRVESFR